MIDDTGDLHIWMEELKRRFMNEENVVRLGKITPIRAEVY